MRTVVLVSILLLSTRCAAADERSAFRAVDFSLQTQHLVDDRRQSLYPLLKQTYKVDTIIRYYDEECETLPGKTLSLEESKAIISAGLQLAVVFQHRSDDPTKFFEKSIGVKDANRALILAERLGQPYKTAIYFGIDGPERHLVDKVPDKLWKDNNGQRMSPDKEQAYMTSRGSCAINSYRLYVDHAAEVFGVNEEPSKVDSKKMYAVFKRYFDDIRTAFQEYARSHEGNTYKIGIYCTSAICSFAKREGLAEFYWLSAEGRDDKTKGHDDSIYDEFLQQHAGEDWFLIQSAPVLAPWAPGGRLVEFDVNYVNPKHDDYGQWGEPR
jgi:Domain of unknown function (DUF1906)